MSTDWIKMRVDLREDPAVFRLAKLTKLDRLSVVGRLWAFWSWADKHAIDGQIAGSDASDVDEVTDRKGFAGAMQDVGWLTIGDGFVAIPKHDRHTGESAKERSLKNARQARWRQSRDANVDAPPSTDVDALPSTQASTRVEKSREEKKEKEITDPSGLVVVDPPGSTSDPPKTGAYAVPDCPYQAIVKAYHEALPSLPRVSVLNDARRQHIRARWREVCVEERFDAAAGLEWFRWLFVDVVAPSRFLTGRSRPDRDGHVFSATLDWLFLPTNFAKVVDGNYRNEKATA